MGAKVSVIIPVYNVEKYIAKCLESCIAQTLYDVEFICVVDGSTDASAQILEQYAAMDNRIQVIYKENGGLSSARNAGMKASTGELVMFLDSDDYISENACERVWVEHQHSGYDILTFGTEIIPILPDAGPWYRQVLHTRTHQHHSFTPAVLFDDPNSKPFVWRQAYTRKLLEQTGLTFDETIKYGEDMIFQLQIFPQAKRFVYIADRLYHYRWCREGSLMSAANQDQDVKIQQHLQMVDIISAYWQDKGWLEQYGRDYLGWVLEFMVPDLRRMKLEHLNDHVAALRAIVEKYGLARFNSGLSKEKKALWNILKQM